MPALADNILHAVVEGRYVFGIHADERLRERRIMGRQVIEGLESATLLAERDDTLPNPTVEFEQLLPDGAACKVVWAWIATTQTAKLVTVHFFDR